MSNWIPIDCHSSAMWRMMDRCSSLIVGVVKRGSVGVVWRRYVGVGWRGSVGVVWIGSLGKASNQMISK